MPHAGSTNRPNGLVTLIILGRWSGLQPEAIVKECSLHRPRQACSGAGKESPKRTVRQRIHFMRKQIAMSFRFSSKRQFGLFGVLGAMIFAVPLAFSQGATGPGSGRALESVLVEKLSIVKGKVLTAQIVHYPPGGASKSHRHDADVFAFILSGKIRSQSEGSGEAKVYNVGEGRFERRGQHHMVSENASATEPASMLVVFIADEGATLTTFD